MRIFLLPNINFEASNYTKLIGWTYRKLSFPPMIENVSIENLEELLNTKGTPKFEFITFPCHSQSVEKIVKLVTGSSTKVYGEENRDNCIRLTLFSRSAMPSFNCKKDFKTYQNFLRMFKNKPHSYWLAGWVGRE